MNKFYETISTPVITDMDFTYPHTSDIVNTGYDTLFAGSDAIVLARYPAGIGNIDSSIDATTRTGSRSFDKTFPTIPGPDNSFVPKLWAHTKILDLMDLMVVEGETNAIVSEITDLSLEFGFVTPYTSLFVEVPVLDKISEATTESGTLAEPEAMVTATHAYEDVDDTGDVMTVQAPEATPTRSLGGGGATDEADQETSTSPRTSRPRTSRSNASAPGFGALFAITGLVAIAYLLRRR
ncbi:MAG: hypothetical protein C5S49_07165 [Candidatus Methanogaster sp.]|nr:MAG: hypothetical protein C5S49_07165 [ANME-2 cluster archaeon]